MTRIGGGNIAPRAITQADRSSTQLETSAAQARQQIQRVARQPVPQDPKERAAVQKQMARFERVAQKFDKASTSAHKEVAAAGKSLAPDAAKEVDKKVGKSLAAVDKTGTAIFHDVKSWAKAASAKPGKAGKAAGSKAAKNPAKEIQTLTSMLEKMLAQMEDVKKSIIGNIK